MAFGYSNVPCLHTEKRPSNQVGTCFAYFKRIGISMLGLKGRQDIAGGEAPCKDNKIIQAPKGRQDVLFS